MQPLIFQECRPPQAHHQRARQTHVPPQQEDNQAVCQAAGVQCILHQSFGIKRGQYWNIIDYIGSPTTLH